jgi:RNA polymerase sigma-70 factor (ECF subfamily)
VVATGGAEERARLVRLCARLTGDWDTAEDLAQETLLAAEVNRSALRDPGRRWHWLVGIARHLAVDWVRRRGRERRRLAPGAPAARDAGSTSATAALAELPAAFNLELALERSELAALLDRAMALLPPDTRRVLVERLIEATPQAQVALRLGLSEGAVEARLHRGKLALRRILTTDLREEAVAYGLVELEPGTWQPTRIWCPVCGQRRLVGRFVHPGGELQLDCVDCPGVAGGPPLARCHILCGARPEVDGHLRGFKPAFDRHLAQIHGAYGHGIRGRHERCRQCGFQVPVQVVRDDRLRLYYSLAYCPRCRHEFATTAVTTLADTRPEGRRFRRDNPRARLLPDQELEAGGRPAILTRLQSLTSSAELAVVYARDTLEVLAISGIHGVSPEDGRGHRAEK